MIFKMNYLRWFFYLLLINLFIIVVLFIITIKVNVGLLIIFVVNVYYFTTVITSKNPFSIIIDKEERILKIEFISLKNKVEQYSLNELQCSYKTETGARGLKRKVFRLFYNNQCILELLPHFNGWSNSSLQLLYTEIIYEKVKSV